MTPASRPAPRPGRARHLVWLTALWALLFLPHLGTPELDAEFQDYITETAWGGLWTRPHFSMRERSIVTLSILAALGRDGELTLHAKATRNTGATPCLIAAMHGHTEALKALIAGGADVKKSTGSPQDDDMSPAEYAAQNGHGACLQLLLGAGAKPPREWGVEEGESCVFSIGQGFNMVFKTSCSTSE